MPDLKYSKSHEWVLLEGDIATVGISQHAVDELGEVVPFDLPQVGKKVSAGSPMGEIESVKAVSELFAPLSGEVVESNSTLETQPELVNVSPLADGWIVKIRVSDATEVESLLSQAEYERFVEEEG